MPTLNWLGKESVVNHHHDVPFKTLEKQYTFGADSSENKIIHGDNLEALKALLPEYEGRIKCIYIDPPYNTGNEGWVYNDNVNSPRIQKWLGQVVGKEAEDLSRHDKWLCMMYPRLTLLHQLLADDGAIFISIDDNEQANLKLLCDEIFGSGNFEGCIHWRRRHNQPNDKTKLIGLVAEFIFVYAKDSKFLKSEGVGKIPLTGNFSNPDNDPKGEWASNPWKAAQGRGGCEYDIETPCGDILSSTWYGTKETFLQYLEEGRVHWTKNGKGIPRIKIYRQEAEEQGQCASNWWPNDIAGCNQDASDELKLIFSENKGEKTFDTPKPSKLIERIVSLGNDKNGVFLDSFAGSGTTAHAVLNLNKQDGGNRKFILVEMEDYAETITAERVKRVIDGYPFKGKKEEEIYNQPLTIKNLAKASDFLEEADAIAESKKDEYDKISKPKIEDNCIKVIGTKVYDEKMEGLGGDFSFYELGEPIMNGDYINENQPVEKIKEYIWYSETHSKYEGREGSYFLGNHNGAGYYFYYEKNSITTLSYDTLNIVEERAEQYIIYADQCLIDKDDLLAKNIIFKKIPRDIRKF